MDIFNPQIGLIFWQTLLLIIVYLILRIYAWKPLLQFIQNEEKRQINAEEQTKKVEKHAATLRKMSEKALQVAEQEAAQILAEAKATKKALEQEAIEEAKHQKEQLLQKAEEQIRHKQAQALSTIKKQATTLILDTTQKVLQVELAKDQVRNQLIEKLITQLPHQQNAVDTPQE